MRLGAMWEKGRESETPITGSISRYCRWNHKPYAMCPLPKLHKASVKVMQITKVLGVLHSGHHERS